MCIKTTENIKHVLIEISFMCHTVSYETTPNVNLNRFERRLFPAASDTKKQEAVSRKNNVILSPVDFARNLGVIFDKKSVICATYLFYI